MELDHIHHVAINHTDFFLREDGTLDMHLTRPGELEHEIHLEPEHAYALLLFMQSPVTQAMISKAVYAEDSEKARTF